MSERIEWRLRDGADTLLRIDESRDRVAESIRPDAQMLKSYLATRNDLEAWKPWDGWSPVEAVDWDPESWGELVLSRADHGGIRDAA